MHVGTSTQVPTRGRVCVLEEGSDRRRARRRPTDMLAAQKAVTKAKASSGVERIRYASED